MRTSDTPRITAINDAKDRFISVKGPPIDHFPHWGIALDTPRFQYHLHPAISYELHYRLPFYCLVHTFNRAQGLCAMGTEPLAPWSTDVGGSCLIAPGLPVKIVQETPLEFLAIGIDVALFEEVAHMGASQWGGMAEIYKTLDPALASMCNEIRRTMIAETMGVGSYLDALTHALITRLLSAHLAHAPDSSRGKETLAPFLTKRLAKIIEEKLDGPIKVNELAAEAQLSRSHFSRAFARSFGMAPQQYIMSRRVAAARTLLTSSQIPITDVAIQCGFANPSHLTTAFKKELGLTPKDYRKALS